MGLKGAGPEDIAHCQDPGFSVQHRGGVGGTFVLKVFSISGMDPSQFLFFPVDMK